MELEAKFDREVVRADFTESFRAVKVCFEEDTAMLWYFTDECFSRLICFGNIIFEMFLAVLNIKSFTNVVKCLTKGI